MGFHDRRSGRTLVPNRCQYSSAAAMPYQKGHARRDLLTCDSPTVISPVQCANTVVSPRDRPDDRFCHLERRPARERNGNHPQPQLELVHPRWRGPLLTPALVLRQVRRGQNPKQRYQDRRQRSAETDPSHERDPREASDRRLGRLMRSATWSSRWRARTNGSSREPFILFAFCALIVTGMVWLIESLAHGQPSGRWLLPASSIVAIFFFASSGYSDIGIIPWRGRRECRRRCTAASQRPGESILIRDAGSRKRRAADRRAWERERRWPRGVTISGESAAIAGSLHPLCGRGRMERQLVCGDGVTTRGLTRRRPPDGRCPRMCGNRRSALAP